MNNIHICEGFFQRLFGLIFKDDEQILIFPRCNSIHTFFMKEAIDVIFCNDDNVILYYYKDVSPGKVILPRKGATKVFELPVNYFDINISDKLEVK